MKFGQDKFQFTWINSDTLCICYNVNGTKSHCSLLAYINILKGAATQLFKRQMKNRAFFKIIELLL